MCEDADAETSCDERKATLGGAGTLVSESSQVVLNEAWLVMTPSFVRFSSGYFIRLSGSSAGRISILIL